MRNQSLAIRVASLPHIIYGRSLPLGVHKELSTDVHEKQPCLAQSCQVSCKRPILQHARAKSDSSSDLCIAVVQILDRNDGL